MATQTSNLGLTKPAYDEAADVVPAVNNNMDAIDAAMGAVPANTSVQAQITANAQAIAKLDESIAIVSNGNTHAAIAAGQYVYIKGHGTLAEGLYTANSAISANATLSNSNVTAVSGGGLNALNSKITWHYLGHTTKLNGDDAVTYPADAKELFFEQRNLQYVQAKVVPLCGGGTYYYTASSGSSNAAFQINRSTRKTWCYSGQINGEALTEANCYVYYK